MLKLFGHWQLPLLCTVIWWGMLIAMLIAWAIQGRPNYGTDEKHILLTFISDIGATSLKALFVVCATVQAVLLVLSVTAERYLRHAGRLHPIFRRREKVCAAFSIFFAVIGQLGLIFLSGFDTVRYSRVHFFMLAVFLVGMGLSIFFMTVEFFLLSQTYRQVNRLRISYFFYGCWLIIAIIIIIIMAAFWGSNNSAIAAVFEWMLAYFYGFYLLILVYSLYPAAVTPRGQLLEKDFGQSLSRTNIRLPERQNMETTEIIEQELHTEETFYRKDSTVELRREA